MIIAFISIAIIKIIALYVFMVKVLFLGDIVGRPGRSFVCEKVNELKADLSVHIVIVNGENAAGGSGITLSIAQELFSSGVDGITLGDHIWDQKGFENEIGDIEGLCRPSNLPKQNPGRTHIILKFNSFTLGVFSVLGRNYINLKSSCPFQTVDSQIEAIKNQCDAILVEAHMEATSEKIALGWYLDGKIAGLIGTHTHTPTADGRILPKGTAYISDVGMCGSYQSVLGREIDPVINSFKDGIKRRFPVADQDIRLSGCLIGIDEKRGLAESFQRFELKK